GPISGVTAGQYVLGLACDVFLVGTGVTDPAAVDLARADFKPYKNWGSVLLAAAVTLYFFRQNLRGIHESSDKALKIMIVTTIMGAIMLGWCGLTLVHDGPRNPVPSPAPALEPRLNYNVDPPEMEDPLGFLKNTSLAGRLRAAGHDPGFNWFSLVGVI